MPLLDSYTAEVTITVRLRSSNEKDAVVNEYTVIRKAQGSSAGTGRTPAAERMTAVVDEAMIKAVAAERALRAGMQNAESRRLK